jgi:uncharacterized protein YecE (DUF72 family)
MTELRIGTSGWSYKSWRGPFFPEDVRVKDRLAYYSSRFNSTELNAPFYRTPTLDAVRGWAEQTPDDFRFAWKASKFITHWKRLTDKCENSLDLMETRLNILGRKTGPILFQLPPQFHADRERLAGFIKLLRERRRYVFEFRHASWYEPQILDLLRDHDIALCLSDHSDAPAPWEVTARTVYIRGHGPTGRYHSHYPDATLEKWARDIRRWRKGRHDVWCFFDNDQKSAAPKDAELLLALLTPARQRRHRAASAEHRVGA